MPTPSVDDIKQVLAEIAGPGGGSDIVTSGVVQGLAADGGKVTFALEIDPKFASLFEPVRDQAEKAVAALPGISSVTAVLTAHSDAPAPSQAQAAPPQQRRGKHGGPPPPTPEAIPGVKAIVAVASGKGGVGKSTIAVNLAVALNRLGLKTGLLDADVYGPSLPTMLGVHDRPESDGKKLHPIVVDGLKTMSMGMLVPGDAPMVWRGPMITSAITQMLRDVEWGELDVLVVDMPPGTGDAQLTLVQRVPVTGAVIVSTPQEIALIDARKGLAMFQKVNVPVFGIVQNMSWMEMPDGSRVHVFGEGGAARTADELKVPFLGDIPLNPEIRQAADDGVPIVASNPESASAKAFVAMAENVSAALERV